MVTLALAIAWLASLPAQAHASDGPQLEPYPPAIAAPRDVPYAGVIALAIDATDVQHSIFTIRERIPVQANGLMTLLYPAWEPASHARTASVVDLAGLIIHVEGKRVEWRRDAVDMHAFHIDVPDGARSIDLEFQFLSHASDALLRNDMVSIQWHRMLLYPAGWYARRIPVEASVTLPGGLRAFTSLQTDHAADNTTTFKRTSLETLTDSPVIAGRYTKQILLGPKGKPPVRLDLVADEPESLAETADDVRKLRAMIEQSARLFGSTHFAHYDAIVTLSDALSPGGGIEHLESGESNLPASYFTDNANQLNNRDLIAHEYVHSWNGRFRQPADMWVPTLNLPMRDSLLWVYEGQTEFWGRVLAARSGLRTRQETLDKLALDFATVATRSGRRWKTLADSSNDPLFVIGRRMLWRDWQRREDYYPEGVALWLDVDGLIRQRSGGKRSLDDFARSFFGINDGSLGTVTYTFEDVCAALNAIEPHDWKAFFQQRLEGHDAIVLDGLERLGWRLVYTDARTETFRQDEVDAGATNLTYSIGLAVTDQGNLKAVSWHGPAFIAGLAPGMRITSINGETYASERLQAAVTASTTTPLVIGYEANGRSQTTRIDYQGPQRYPRLERIPGSADGLAAILAPR